MERWDDESFVSLSLFKLKYLDVPFIPAHAISEVAFGL
jgi:hypothetical protein